MRAPNKIKKGQGVGCNENRLLKLSKLAEINKKWNPEILSRIQVYDK